MNESRLKVFRKSLLNWYVRNKRDLPWRKTADPYAIWLSEIMLQQTTVEVVIPYYHRFLKRFPNLRTVANATEEELLKYWAGLGYYNRIRNFHKAAQIILGFNPPVIMIPHTKAELIKLPGLGNYTAAAVASIAFGEPVAVVDGNVIRVLSRLFRYGGDIGDAKAKKFFQTQAQALLDPLHSGDFNQAMMEMGATLCRSSEPFCDRCPLQKWCGALKEGKPGSYPISHKKIIYREEQHTVFVLNKRDKILLRKRTTDEIMAGLWEFPPFRLSTSRAEPLPPVRHTIMNRRMKIHPYWMEIKNGWKEPKKFSGQWIPLSKIQNFPLTTISKKILALWIKDLTL